MYTPTHVPEYVNKKKKKKVRNVTAAEYRIQSFAVAGIAPVYENSNHRNIKSTELPNG